MAAALSVLEMISQRERNSLTSEAALVTLVTQNHGGSYWGHWGCWGYWATTQNHDPSAPLWLNDGTVG